MMVCLANKCTLSTKEIQILPMLRFSTLSQRPVVFKRLTGVSLEEFEVLRRKTQTHWERLRRKRLDRPDRIRSFGGGRKSKLQTFEDELLLLLVFYRLYPTVLVLGFMVGLDDSNVCRHLSAMEEALAKARITWLKRPTGAGKINSIEELFARYPELTRMVVDSTEQPIQRPKQKNQRRQTAKQRKYYSGKKKRHTIKHQLVVTKDKRIFDVSDSHPGSCHDKTIFEKEGIKDKIPKGAELQGDKSYQGLQKDPGLNMTLPRKASRWHKLTLKDKRHNKKLAKERIIVEHVIGGMKFFQVLTQRYRHQLEKNDRTFKNIAAIWNMKLTTRPILIKT